MKRVKPCSGLSESDLKNILSVLSMIRIYLIHVFMSTYKTIISKERDGEMGVFPLCVCVCERERERERERWLYTYDMIGGHERGWTCFRVAPSVL